MPLWFWGLAGGGLLGVAIGLIIPDVSAALGGAILFGVLGAAIGGLVTLASRRRQHRPRRDNPPSPYVAHAPPGHHRGMTAQRRPRADHKCTSVIAPNGLRPHRGTHGWHLDLPDMCDNDVV